MRLSILLLIIRRVLTILSVLLLLVIRRILAIWLLVVLAILLLLVVLAELLLLLKWLWWVHLWLRQLWLGQLLRRGRDAAGRTLVFRVSEAGDDVVEDLIADEQRHQSESPHEDDNMSLC